ncbi:MAG: hypothetical protein IJ180_02295 [Bacteroidales bacterium]|nr:hypothetical protein [Bacteroidales bacterium]
MKKNLFWVSVVLMFCLCNIILSSCTNEEDYATGKNVQLKFSSDTISFDTIFTTVGSVTKQVRIFNRENAPVKIDRIFLGGGQSSYYRLNVDGDTSLVAKNIEIGAKDSIFVFVRVEIEPNNQNTPLLVQDSIVVAFNGKEQYIQLVSYGQDAYYHKPTHSLGENGKKYSLANEGGAECGIEINGNNITWKNDKPHIILGTCVVDSAYTLYLQSGTNIYMDNKAEMWVYKDGSIQAQGTTNSPVLFSSIRYQDRYSSIPGQWGGIWLMVGSKDNVMDNVIVKNASIGIMADSCVTNNPTLHISNSFIENCSQIGLYSRGANIRGENLIVQNTGSYTVALSLGGEYEFIGCTFANYWYYDNNRKNAVLVLNDWYESTVGIQVRSITKADFYNTVIYGSLSGDEIEFDLYENSQSVYKFDHCLIKSNSFNNNSSFASNCLFNTDPNFVDVYSNDLHPNQNSPLIGNGDGVWNSLLAFDIFGVLRKDPPTIGAIEYTESSNKRR